MQMVWRERPSAAHHSMMHQFRDIEFDNCRPYRSSSQSRGLEPPESSWRITQRAIVQELVQRQKHLVAILAAGLFQVTEVDQPIDKRFRQVEGNSMRSSRRRCDRYMRRPPASAVVDPAAR